MTLYFKDQELCPTQKSTIHLQIVIKCCYYLLSVFFFIILKAVPWWWAIAAKILIIENWQSFVNCYTINEGASQQLWRSR